LTKFILKLNIKFRLFNYSQILNLFRLTFKVGPLIANYILNMIHLLLIFDKWLYGSYVIELSIHQHLSVSLILQFMPI